MREPGRRAEEQVAERLEVAERALEVVATAAVAVGTAAVEVVREVEEGVLEVAATAAVAVVMAAVEVVKEVVGAVKEVAAMEVEATVREVAAMAPAVGLVGVEPVVVEWGEGTLVVEQAAGQVAGAAVGAQEVGRQEEEAKEGGVMG